MSEGLALNLAGADTKGFDAIPGGSYDAAVFEVKMGAVKEDSTGALPGGTPFLNVQFRIDGGEYDNRRVFRKYFIAPAKIDGKPYEKKALMDGMIARFFMALGYEESEVTSGKFNPDFDELVGKECRVSVKVKQYQGEDQNEVTGVKPRTDEVEGGGIL